MPMYRYNGPSHYFEINGHIVARGETIELDARELTRAGNGERFSEVVEGEEEGGNELLDPNPNTTNGSDSPLVDLNAGKEGNS